MAPIGRGSNSRGTPAATWLLATLLVFASLGLGGCLTEEDSPDERNQAMPATGDDLPEPEHTTKAEPVDTESTNPPEATSESGEEHRGELLLSWPPVTHPDSQRYLDAFRNAETFEATVELLNALLKLPEDLHTQHQECNEENAFYLPQAKQIVLCYEMLALAGHIFDDATYTDEDHSMAVSSAWMFIFFHELGHGLVDVYDLPITGREEDAVDDLATLLWIDLGAPEAALMAAVFWYGLDDGEYTDADYAGEHSLDKQRFYQIMCTVYGSDPAEFKWLVDEGHLPTERAERCPSEYEQKDSSWAELLDPWIKASSESELPDRMIEFPEVLPRPGQSKAPIPTSSSTLASNERISIPAGEGYYHGAELSDAATLSYAFQVVDTSTLDVAIIEYDDLHAYQNGQQVPGWESHERVREASGSVQLPADTYALVFDCRNAFFACDLEYSFRVEGDPGESGGDTGPEPEVQHHASVQQIAIAAGEVYDHQVDLSPTGAISYWFEVLDTSTLDVGIIRAEDVQAYRQGYSVDTWAYHSEVQWAEDGAELPANRYAFVLACLNYFNNCDLEYSLASAP